MVFMGHILFVEKLAAPRPVVLSAGSFLPAPPEQRPGLVAWLENYGSERSPPNRMSA
jgi:hypothetical protein